MDSSVGASAMGGWLEEGASMSPGHENNDVQAMDIDLGSPTPSDRKRNLNDEAAGVGLKKIEIFTGNGSTEAVGSGTAASTQTKQSSDFISRRSMKAAGQASEEVPDTPKKSRVVVGFCELRLQRALFARAIPCIFHSGIICESSEVLHESLRRCLILLLFFFLMYQDQDVGRHRMRPRDPRRILLENAAENVQVNQRIAPVHDETVDFGITTHKQRNSPPPTASVILPHQASSKTSGNLQDQRQVCLKANEVNQAVFSTTLSEQLSSEQRILASSKETLHGEINRERGKEFLEESGRETPSATSEVSIRGEVADHLDPWDPLLRKPRFGPSHWGGSDMHRDFELLLGDLDEPQRVIIQNERKRRMQEQDRMFSAGKLCLVLDLDHTLLNSAKVTFSACGATRNCNEP